MEPDQPYLALKPEPVFALLPVEVILKITQHFVTRRDRRRQNLRTLLALSQVSRRFNTILIDDLARYNVMHMRSSGLQWPVSHNDVSLVAKLLKYGGDITLARSGYPLSIAVKNGNIDMLNFLLATANKDQVARALEQGVNHNLDTVLHRAIRLADPPCVRALLGAGADPGRINISTRPVEYLYKLPNKNKEYAEIIQILIETHPHEILRARNTTPLVLAVEQKSLDVVWSILDAGREHCEIPEFATWLNREYSRLPLQEICKAARWNDFCREACDRTLCIALALVQHGAKVNIPNEAHRSPLYLSCCAIPDIFRHGDRCTRNALDLQRDMIRFLLESGANANEWHDRFGGRDHGSPVARFLATAKCYVRDLLQSGKPRLETAEDILEDSIALLMFEENTSLRNSLFRILDTRNKFKTEPEDEQTAILRLLQEMFVALLDRFNDVELQFGPEGSTLLFLACGIPGDFGVFAAHQLLEKGAKIYYENLNNEILYDWVLTNHKSSPICSLLRWWRKNNFDPNWEGVVANPI